MNANTTILKVVDLHASVEGKAILKGIDLKIKGGEVHAIMGPNGSGKSTLAHVLAGQPGYEVTHGHALYQGKDLLAMPVEERARQGLFLAFQYPVEIAGVPNLYLMKASINAVRKERGESELDAMEILEFIQGKMAEVEMNEELLERSVNAGFSGGEKKRNEVLQMLLLEPTLAILDETDSGLDVDALKAVARGVNAMRDPKRAILIVTHYQRMLDYIVPDQVHIMADGCILKSGGRDLALEVEEEGYGWIRPQEGSSVEER